MLGTGAPQQPTRDLRVDLIGCRVGPVPSKSLAQHALAHLVEVQGETQPLRGGLRRRHGPSLLSGKVESRRVTFSEGAPDMLPRKSSS
jgi:hypothetical protein